MQPRGGAPGRGNVVASWASGSTGTALGSSDGVEADEGREADHQPGEEPDADREHAGGSAEKAGILGEGHEERGGRRLDAGLEVDADLGVGQSASTSRGSAAGADTSISIPIAACRC